MLSRFSKGLAVAAMAAPLLALNTPASAGPLVATVTGTGTVSPGIPTVLPTDCVAQTSVKFDAILAVGAGSGHAGLYDVHFSGASIGCESVLGGKGSGNLSGNVSGSVTYERTLAALTITSSTGITVDGHNHSLTAECEIAVTSANPTKSFALTCQAVLT